MANAAVVKAIWRLPTLCFSALKDRLTTLKTECDAQSQYNRRDNLLFSGIQTTTAEVAAAAIGHPTAASTKYLTDKIIAFYYDNLSVDVT